MAGCSSGSDAEVLEKEATFGVDIGNAMADAILVATRNVERSKFFIVILEQIWLCKDMRSLDLDKYLWRKFCVLPQILYICDRLASGNAFSIVDYRFSSSLVTKILSLICRFLFVDFGKKPFSLRRFAPSPLS